MLSVLVLDYNQFQVELIEMGRFQKCLKNNKIQYWIFQILHITSKICSQKELIY